MKDLFRQHHTLFVPLLLTSFLTFVIFFNPITPALATGADTTQVRKSPLNFSLVPMKNVDQQFKEMSPLFDLLEEKLNRPIHTIRSKSYHVVIEGILSKKIDFAIFGPASYAKAKARDNGIEAFASFSRKKGFLTPQGSYYYSVLLTLKDMGFNTLENLEGKKVAFTDPSSTSGSVIPNMAVSKQIGKPLKDFFNSLIYTGSHDRSIQAVIRKQVDGAFVSSVRIDEAIFNGTLSSDNVKILWQSQPIHFDPFVFSAGVDDTLKMKIKSVMFSSAPQVKQMLKNMGMVDIVEVTDENYRPIHDIIAAKTKNN